MNVLNWLGHEFLHYSGSNDSAGTWYGFWSGFGGDIPIIIGLFAVLRHLNCHTKGCYRPGLHKVDGTPFTTCKTHHPKIDHTERVTAELIRDAHAKAVVS